MTAFIIVLLFCFPLVLGPWLIPWSKRAREEVALERLTGGNGELPRGLSIGPQALSCREPVEACATLVDCGGRIQLVMEADEAVGVIYRLATFCPLCGCLTKESAHSLVLGKDYAHASDLNGLESAVRAARRRQWWDAPECPSRAA